ncbi:MAG: hypothetical protein ACREBV_09540 [Candidatus Zixiibacteriota bacterium]
MESILLQPTSWLGILGSLAVLLAGHIATRYIIPFLSVGKRQRLAELIALLADEITDELQAKYAKDWTKYLDQAVDKLIMILGIDSEVARRAINAAAARKK